MIITMFCGDFTLFPSFPESELQTLIYIEAIDWNNERDTKYIL